MEVLRDSPPGGANNDGTVFSLSVGLGPFVETQPTSGKVGAAVKILGTDLTGATSVTLIGPKTRYYRFATLDGLRSFVVRCNPENMPEFERSVRAWSRGSDYVNLTDEQYAKLKR